MGSNNRRRGKKAASNAARKSSDSSQAKPSYDDWVWWPNGQGRRSRAEEEFFKLPAKAQGELADRMKRVLDGTTRAQDVDNGIGHGLRELRVRIGSNHYRVLFFISGRVCVGLTCFFKNQQRLELTDLERAKQRMSSYRS